MPPTLPPKPTSPPQPQPAQPTQQKSLTSSPSWSRVNPQTFVNGRGNVQLVPAPRPYVPGTYDRGQQAYLRDNNSASTSASASGSGGAGLGVGVGGGASGSGLSNGTHAGGEQRSFPSQFGVRQRVALKIGGAGSRDSLLASSSSAGHGGDSTRNSLYSSPTSTTASPSSASPITTIAAKPTSPLDKRKLSNASVSSATSGTGTETETEGGGSTVDGLGGGGGGNTNDLSADTTALGSILKAPEWNITFSPIPTPTSTLPSSQHSPIPSPLSQTTPPSSSSSSTSPPPPPPLSSSILNRPRPKTPDPSEAIRFSTRPVYRRAQSSSTSFRSFNADQPLPPPPTAPPNLALPAPPPLRPFSTSTTYSVSTSVGGSSIMDRGRPRTPDPMSCFSSPSSTSSHFPPSALSSHNRTPTSHLTPDLSSPLPLPPTGTGTSSPVRPLTPDPLSPSPPQAFHSPTLSYSAVTSPNLSSSHSHSPSLPSQSILDSFSSPTPSSLLQASPPPSQPSKDSILNRPRPRTPEPSSILNRPRPNTPEPFLGLATISTPPVIVLRNGGEKKKGHGKAGSGGGSGSVSGVLDRPRPKTPERKYNPVVEREKDLGWWVPGGVSGSGEKEKGAVKISRIPGVGTSPEQKESSFNQREEKKEKGKGRRSITREERENKELPSLDFEFDQILGKTGEDLDLGLGKGLGFTYDLNSGSNTSSFVGGGNDDGMGDLTMALDGERTPMPTGGPQEVGLGFGGFGFGDEWKGVGKRVTRESFPREMGSAEDDGAVMVRRGQGDRDSGRSSLMSNFRRGSKTEEGGGSPELDGAKKKRRRSLASLLSLSVASSGGSPNVTPKADSSAQFGTTSGTSYENGSISTTGTTSSTELPPAIPFPTSSINTGTSPPSNHPTPNLNHRPTHIQTASLTSTPSIFLDKSLPPTPSSASPTLHDSPTKSFASVLKPSTSPSTSSAASSLGVASSKLQRGLSKLRSGVASGSGSGRATPEIGFQVISATSTKKFGNGAGVSTTWKGRRSEEGGQRAASGGVLGMSLLGGRKSEDVLSKPSGLVVGVTEKDLGSGGGKAGSTDQLLMLAAARLSDLRSSSTLSNQSEPTTAPSSKDHETSSTLSVSVSDDSSPSPQSPHFDLATVQHKTIPTATAAAGSGVPVLLRGDSLRGLTKTGFDRTKEVNAPSVTVGAGKWRKRSKVLDSGVGSDSSMSSAWLDLEDNLAGYVLALSENKPERSQILSNTLLPFLKKEEENPGPRAGAALARRQRQVLFGWLAALTRELREVQPTHRGACLEGVAGIAESHFLSASSLQEDADDLAQYRTAIVNILSFAVEKLNDKAVYANTLVFSGRVFALAFFRIEGVALKLLRALPSVKRQFLTRVLDEAGVHESRLPPVELEAFPPHLWSLCLRDFRTYVNLLLPAIPKPATADDRYLVQDGNVVVEMTGNWLIRWTASDSDLPFAFYRAYHRQLASHVVPPEYRDEVTADPPMDPSIVITGPGALFIAASLLEKSDALVHRNLRSVTSIGPNSANFNTNDSANLNFGQKPKVLELANRRLVSTMLDIVGGPPPAVGEAGEVPADAETRRHAFSRLLRVWIRACVKKTSMWDTRSVFILLDLIEGLVYTLSYPAPSSRGTEEEVIVPRPQLSCIEMFDIPFIFSFVKIILGTADNTVALMRTIAFLYAHFEIFTLRSADRDELCENIILDETLFCRLYLHWNAGVRGYFIRLLVWRLARLGVVAQEQNPGSVRDPRIPEIFALLNFRLEAIRKRHDELEPLDNLTDDDLFFKPKRSTICSTRGVKEMPFTVDELVVGTLNESDEDAEEEDEPQELVRSTAVPLSGRREGIKNVATVAKVVSWFKGGLGKGRNNKSARSNDSRIQPFILSPPASEIRNPFDGPASGTSWASPNSSPDRTHLTVTTTPERRTRPVSPAFFEFEFEGGLTSPDAPPKPAPSISSGEASFPLSPTRRTFEGPGAPSPRVSLRFSKRISILPPAALDILKEIGEAVPPIPPQYLLSSSRKPYDQKLHPYAIRGLRDYEDALDEWTDWMNRLQEEEDTGKKHNKGFMDIVPRLSVAWPSSFEDGA